MATAALLPVPATAFPAAPGSAGDAVEAATSALWHKARVICRVYTKGNTRHTEFCEDGYTCDLANRKCLPGPEILRQREKERQVREQASARRAYKGNAQRRAEDNRLVKGPAKRPTGAAPSGSRCVNLGGSYSCTSANWSGNPKEMPTPRHYSSGTAHTMSRAVRAHPIAQRLQQNRVPPNVSMQIANLLVIWQDLQVNDPNRETIDKQIRELARCCNIPINPDEYLGAPKPAAAPKCGIPTIKMRGGLDALQLRWAPQDLPERAVQTKVCEPGAGLQDCVKEHYGELVMGVEPGIRSFCRLQEVNTPPDQYTAQLNTCAQRKFDNAWAYLGGLTWMWQSATEIDPGRKCSDADRANHDSLRDKIRGRIRAMPDGTPQQPPPPKDENKDNDIVDVEEALPTDAPTVASPADDVLCAYLARWSVRGKLQADKSPELPKECQAAVDTAKNCATESCQMAKVIDDQEREAAKAVQPWGADDRRELDEMMIKGLDLPSP